MHLGTKDYTWQLFSLLSTCQHLSASLSSFGIWLEFMDYCWSLFNITLAQFSCETNLSYHLYTCSPTLILFMSTYLLTVYLGTISGLLIAVKGQAGSPLTSS